MKNELNTNNSKKLIIGVSILFCAVILIIGGTIAYFTQSDTKNMDSLVTANINDTLEYKDNTTYMRQELIPAKESVAKQAYAIEGDNKCLDMNGYSACSIYEFNIKNTSIVSQELIIDLIPTVNTFTNLHFILYEIDEDGNSNELISSQKIDMLTEEIIQNNNIPTYNLKKDINLNSNKDKTYQLVFFINDTGSDQTKEDAGKQFGGTIKISSVATGQYIAKSFGTNCWTTELLPDNTYKLKAFHGIDNTIDNINFGTGEITLGENYGKINESCTGYIDDDDEDGFYSVYIPSNVGGQKISTLGNELFSAMVMNEAEGTQDIRGNYGKINNIKIEEGITTIEDGCFDNNCEGTQATTFLYIGMDLNTFDIFENFSLNISLPNSLEYIGTSTFTNTLINNSIKIPSGVKTIGDSAFYHAYGLKNIIFEKDSKGKSNLTTIGEDAFSSTDIESLIIPNSVTTMGEYAFAYNDNLKSVIFEENSSLTSIEERVFIDSIIETISIPPSVTKIGESAFSSSLKNITFEKDKDGKTNLTTIGNAAFFNDSLETITIPASVQAIEGQAFQGNKNLTTLIFEEGSKLTSIGDMAFKESNIQTLTIPNNVTSIGYSAFFENKNLKTIVFEEGSKLTTIGDYAFESCALDYQNENSPLYLPNNEFTTMGKYAFNNNPNLKYIYYEGDTTGFGESWNGNATLFPRRN